jgi:hypothetical protein
MASKNQPANVKRLRAREVKAHPERVRKIRDWHLQQAHSLYEPAATLNITITACGQIFTTGLAIEPEHAQVLLTEIDQVQRKLSDHAAGRTLTEPAAVLPIQRTA